LGCPYEEIGSAISLAVGDGDRCDAFPLECQGPDGIEGSSKGEAGITVIPEPPYLEGPLVYQEELIASIAV